MLVIREEQMSVLSQAVARNFENRLLEHLQDFFPRQGQILGVEQTRELIRLGIAQAEKYGFETERDVYLYVGLMCVLGSYFDQDPQLPWAAQILADENIADPNMRADRLHERAMAFLNEAAGQESQYLDRALRRLRELPPSALTRTGDDKQISFGDYVLKLLYGLFAEKYHAVGDPAIRQLVREAFQAAKEFGLTGEAGMTTYISLAFMLGGGFARDPRFPWAGAVLNDATLTDPKQKGEALHQSAVAHLEQWL